MSFSWLAVGGGAQATYLEVATGVTALVLLGRYLEARARRQAGAAVRALLDLGARQATVLRDGREVTVDIATLQVGDEFVIRPGEKVATDGIVIAGRSAVDTSMLTGEPVPAEAGPGDGVTGGCVNVGGRLVVRATRVGADTQLAQMARLVTQAQAGKAQVQRLADRVSAVFVPVVLVLAVATLLGWLAAGESAASALTAAVAVLIIAGPCAMGLATPTALLINAGRGAQLGILIKGPEALESTRRVDTVLLDKTGTVTTGRMTLKLGVAAAAVPARAGRAAPPCSRRRGVGVEHPVAAAVVTGARARLGEPLPMTGISDFEAHAGTGASAVADGHAVLVSHGKLLTGQWALSIPSPLAARADAAERTGPDRNLRRLGRRGPRPADRRRCRQAHLPGRAVWPGCGPWACTRCSSPVTTSAPPAPSRRARASTTSSRACCRAGKVDDDQAIAGARAGRSRW